MKNFFHRKSSIIFLIFLPVIIILVVAAVILFDDDKDNTDFVVQAPQPVPTVSSAPAVESEASSDFSAAETESTSQQPSDESIAISPSEDMTGESDQTTEEPVIVENTAPEETSIDVSPRPELLRDYNRIKQNDFDSMCITLPASHLFPPALVETYIGEKAVSALWAPETKEEFADYLEAGISGKSTVKTLYLLFDPAKTDYSDVFFQFAEKHPEISYKIMLTPASLKYWTSLTQENLDKELGTYVAFTEKALKNKNTEVYCPADANWLLANQAHFTTDTAVNSQIAKKLFLLSFCDGAFRRDKKSIQTCVDNIRAAVSAEQESPAKYPNLSEYTFVFFGDSIIDYAHGSHSVPGFVCGLSGSTYASYALGGTCAADNSKVGYSLSAAVDKFISDYNNNSLQASDTSADAVTAAQVAKAVSENKMIFILNYGLNDYFYGLPVDNEEKIFDTTTYAGALRMAIANLRMNFPGSKIITQTPTYITQYKAGTLRLPSRGSILTAYVDVVKTLKSDYCIDNYTASGITPENADKLLADGIHPGEEGRLLVAKHMLVELGQFLQVVPK